MWSFGSGSVFYWAVFPFLWQHLFCFFRNLSVGVFLCLFAVVFPFFPLLCCWSFGWAARIGRGCVYWQGTNTFGDCLEVSHVYPVPFVCCFRLHCASRAGCLYSLIKFSRFKKKRSLVLLFVKRGFDAQVILSLLSCLDVDLLSC